MGSVTGRSRLRRWDSALIRVAPRAQPLEASAVALVDMYQKAACISGNKCHSNLPVGLTSTDFPWPCTCVTDRHIEARR